MLRATACCCLVTVALLGTSQAARGQEARTVEGQWVVLQPTKATTASGYTIRREGDGYNVIAQVPEGAPQDSGGYPLYRGSPTQIMSQKMSTFEDLIKDNQAAGANIPVSVLKDAVGKVPIRFRFTLAPDGQTMELAHDNYVLNWYVQSRRLATVDIVPFAERATLKRVVPVAPPTPAAAQPPETAGHAMAAVVARGEFYILTKDGRKLTGSDAERVPCEDGAKVVTGKGGRVQLVLPDDTVFTIGSNSEVEIDAFVYESAKTPKGLAVQVTKGVFRWVTGKVARKDPADMKVRLPTATIGIRGTDFETTVNADNSGSVTLYFGQLEITEKKTGFTFVLQAGQMVTFDANGSFARPTDAK